MPDPLLISTTFNLSAVPANGPTRLVYLLLEIKPGDLNLTPEPLPVNIGIVVDTSDSMKIPILTQRQFEELARRGVVTEMIVDGVPVWHFEHIPSSFKLEAPRSIDFVKRALQSPLEQLSPQDRFALVAFARDSRVLVPAQSGENKELLLKAIDQLDELALGNDTYMAAGMNAAYEQVKAGFTREMVNRMIVLTDGFTLDAAQCQGLALQAAGSGISISTMGLGVEFNEQLLISIADASGGNAYFIRGPQEIPDVFEKELSGVQNLILRKLNLKLRFMNGVELRRVHRVQPVISDLGVLPLADRGLDLAVGDLGAQGQFALLFELLAPPRSVGQYQLGHAIVEYDLPGAGQYDVKQREDILIQYAEGEGALNPNVMNIVEKVSAFKLQTRALEDAAKGDVAGATQKLKAAATRLINMGEQELAQAALTEAANLEQRGQMSPEGTKRLRYDTRKLTQKLG